MAAQQARAAKAEAEKLQQRADRRRSVETYQQAAAAYQHAIGLAQAAGGLSEEDLADAHFGLGEALVSCAEKMRTACSTLPDEQLSRDAETAAQQRATSLLSDAVTAFRQVTEGSPATMRVDALVATGNALASAADLAPTAEAALYLLHDAGDAYAAALARDEDAGTLSNTADAWVAAARRFGETGRQDEAAELFSRAMAAYQRSCELSSSEEGDDLPGLLHNWGVGLYELGTQALAASDPATAASALAEATSRLEASISFNRADAAPMNALGDVWLARAEQAADVQAAAAAAGAALETGYGAALRVLATDSDALIGRAEAHTLLARLTSQTGDGASSSTHYQQSYEAYRTALQRPTALGSLDDRCNVRYNYACVCAALGKHEEARHLFQSLLAVGGTSKEDLRADQDLGPLRTLPWFSELVQ